MASSRSIITATLGLATSTLCLALDATAGAKGAASAYGAAYGATTSTYTRFVVSASACASLLTSTNLDALQLKTNSALCTAANFAVGAGVVSSQSGSFVVSADFCGGLYTNAQVARSDVNVYVAACQAAHLEIRAPACTTPSGTFAVTAAFCADLYSNTKIAEADIQAYLKACSGLRLAVKPEPSRFTVAVKPQPSRFAVTVDFCSTLYTNAKVLKSDLASYEAACAAAHFDVRKSSLTVDAGLCSSLHTIVALTQLQVETYAAACVSAGLTVGVQAHQSESVSLKAALEHTEVLVWASSYINTFASLSLATFGRQCSSDVATLVASLDVAIRGLANLGTCSTSEAATLYTQLDLFVSSKLTWLETIAAHADLWASLDLKSDLHAAVATFQAKSRTYLGAALVHAPTHAQLITKLQVTLEAKVQSALVACQ